ncbi:succinate dehydrogenase assembly factor 2 [Roseivivax sp. CAU 1753]
MISEQPRHGEPRDTRIRRLKMRSMRRGIKEMDLILIHFSDANLDAMDDSGLTEYDALLSENDQDLYQWITGQVAPPDRFAGLVRKIAAASTGVVADGS